MKKKRFAQVLVLLLAFLLTVFLPGCGQDAGDYDVMEEPEITVEYLSGEYADQILRDGGEQVLGTIEIQKESEDEYALTVHSMVIVESSITGDGYYIADKNLSNTVPLDSEARVTYIKSKKKGPQVMDLAEFIKLVQQDAAAGNGDASDSGNEKLYDVYIIGGNALMILAKELPDA